MTFGSFLACVSYGLGINPAAVRVFRNCGQKIVFHRLFDHISHGLGIDPASFLMRSLGDVRHFSACVSYGLGFNPAAVRVFRNCGQKIVFHRLFDRISHGLGIDPSSFLRRSLGDVRHFSGLCFVWFGHQSCCCSAVSEAFLPVIPSNGFPSAFRSYFAWFGHRSFQGSSFLMRSLGDVRQFSGLCFVWFGHQSCCCSSVSQLRTKDCFPSAFRSYFAWFGHRSF